MHFLSWEHPMVSGAMDMILGGDFGNATLCTIKLGPLKPGTLLLETFFTLHCPAPKALQLHRYLPLNTVRIVVDATDKDLSAVLTTEHFDKLGRKLAKATAHDVVRHARPQITDMVRRAEALAMGKSRGEGEQGILDTAIAAMEQQQQQELQRLVALARVNPNIRQDEINHIIETTAALKGYMSTAEWRLDALRVAISV
jgi:ATP-dependent helicase HepA